MSAIHPRVAVSTITTYGWTLQQALDLLGPMGVPGVGVLYGKAKDDPAGALAALARSGVACSSVTADAGGANLLAPPDEHGSPALRALRASLDFAAAAGGRPCYFVSGSLPPRTPTDDGVEALLAALPPVVAYAAEIGVPLSIEHNNAAHRDVGFINTLQGCIEFARRAGIGVDLEIQNCWIEQHLREMFRDNVDLFHNVQVSDYLVGETTRMNRRVLGDGSIPLEWLLGALLDAGYAGLFEIETLGPAIEAEGYASAVRRSVDWLNQRLVSWGV
jgi:sugar phosphate isomerase/epimerase